ncbi:RDD family protein [Streptomyces violaceus]|uniref:RDD family protein n=4 Tax=Streptomyces TaxID=1883 RepID=A0ABZ1MMW8_STREF|nr:MULTISPECIES: RDD family protein [Streptomyces]MBB3079172.1 putative RDD family membrane protein YckC [Streptomyces violarus]MCE7050795.1 RDD family protein [Streptomyces purpurascens]WND21484.1 RDD family protein [Streptomyces janthinus]WNF61937.1 RDD family protein [Streptomyces sp. CGMCC 4.1456]WRU01722.1 RDD family protein [Streptomyces sp. CGMCC 4.1772]
MDNRQALGSWLSGPRAAAEEAGVDFGYRGEQLGLPEEGPGSIARPGRRLGALAVDWGLSLLIAYGLITQSYNEAAQIWAPLILFALMVLTVGTVGFTPGKRLLGLRVLALDTGRVSPWRTLLRTVLLFLAIPALIWDRDGRGLHDRLAGTVEVRI